MLAFTVHKPDSHATSPILPLKPGLGSSKAPQRSLKPLGLFTSFHIALQNLHVPLLKSFILQRIVRLARCAEPLVKCVRKAVSKGLHEWHDRLDRRQSVKEVYTTQ